MKTPSERDLLLDRWGTTLIVGFYVFVVLFMAMIEPEAFAGFAAFLTAFALIGILLKRNWPTVYWECPSCGHSEPKNEGPD